MTPLELIFTALSEEATRIYAEENDAQGFHENHDAADKGGKTAGNARRGFEKETGRKVVSDANFLGLKGGEKRENYPLKRTKISVHTEGSPFFQNYC
jgi:hypothetical protein